MLLLRIAYRSVFRNKRRTAVTTLAMAIAGATMMLYAALLDGYMASMLKNALGMEIAHIQMHAPGYRESPDIHTDFDPAIAMAALRPDRFAATGRVFGFALAASDDASAGIQLRGLDPKEEATVTEIHQHVADGDWIRPDRPAGAVLGRKLARSLGVTIGAELVLIGQARDGSMANELFRVRGILKTVSPQIDSAAFFVPIEKARDFFVMPTGVHELALLDLDPNRNLELALARAKEAAPELDVHSWRELSPMLAQMIDMGDIGKYFMLLITYAAVLMVVLNATLMSVFERIQSFGVMKALGLGPWQVALTISLEAFVQVLMGLCVSVAISIPMIFYYQKHGIDLSGAGSFGSFGGVAIDPIWYMQFSWRSIWEPALVLVIIVLLASVYPAVKAAVVRPIEALEHR